MRTVRIDSKVTELLATHPDGSNPAAIGYLVTWGMRPNVDDTVVLTGSDTDFPIEIYAAYTIDGDSSSRFLMSGFRRRELSPKLLAPWEFHS